MYSPRVKPEYIGRLYSLCRELGVPMTAFVNGVCASALQKAEECLAKGERDEVLRMIGASVATDAGQ
jgi:hypothetical protein